MLKKQLLITLITIVGTVNVFSQIAQETFIQQEGGALDDSKAIVSNSLWSNWYGQVGVDMSLQNPYGCNFAHVFPNGKSFGIDGALGKWFTPEFGGRGKVNLENTFLQGDHAEWVKVFDKGYITLTGDFLIDLHNFFGDYKPDRIWTLTLYPRAGAFINLNSGKGSPILGLGIGNTFRLNNKWGIYTDISYNAVTSVEPGLVGQSLDTS